MKGYLTCSQLARKWNVSERWVNQYILKGRIKGVEKFGRSWAIPENTAKPEDPRFKKK